MTVTSKKTKKQNNCCITLLFYRNKFLALCTIYKQTKMQSVCISVMSFFFFLIHSIVENLTVFGPRRSVWSKHTPEAVASRHLCFASLHSYYGFHVACKVLCICFDQSLFGMPSHIKMLGIHLLKTNKPSTVLFLKRGFAVTRRFDFNHSDDRFLKTSLRSNL